MLYGCSESYYQGQDEKLNALSLMYATFGKQWYQDLYLFKWPFSIY
jgi:hypothetical protein